jgi:hypothetical protein
MRSVDKSSNSKNDSGQTRGEVGEHLRARRGGVDRIFHTLAKAFNGLHWAVGITTLPETASPREERSFVLMWLGIIVFLLLFFVIMIRLL